MIALYIIGGILLLLVFLLHSPFKIYVECRDNKTTVRLKYLFFRKNLFPQPKKEPTPPQQSQTQTENTDEENPPEEKQCEEMNCEKSSDNPEKDKSQKNKKKKKGIFPEDKKEKFAFIINVLKSSGKALKLFTKRISIKNVTVDIDISDEDACDCAIKFGKANMIVYNIVNFAAVFFRVKKNHININCVYNKPKSVYNFSFVVKFTPSAGIFSAIAFIFTFLVNNIKAKHMETAAKTA